MIRSLLVANRGEIARRIMRTCRAMGIDTVAVHSDPDAGASFVREADLAVSLGGASPSTSYLRIDAIVEAARRSGAEAVHPGYGFLSENAAFARAVLDAGLVWVGPPPDAIDAMGSKLAARERMVVAGVPVVPGADLRGVTDEALGAVGSALGLPLLVKASAGGGGRGMRIVRHLDDLAAAVAGARREAASAFGDDTVFLERYVERPRHIEVQVMADAHGEVVHLFERECSIQRRHQKIVEEAPSPFVTPELRDRMGATAVLAARTVGYVGAGTVEMIVAADGEFFFLEMNTRLQVEHPVTEMITGLDLVRAQIEIACGVGLRDAIGTPQRTGHAIEARLYAEDPDRDYVPSPGRLRRVSFAGGPGLRVDSGYESGDVVGTDYDAMVAKVIAHGATRADAARLLAHALRRARVDGVVTNRALLVGVVEHPEFLAGETDTGFLERHPPSSLLAGHADDDAVALAAIAAALAEQAAARAGAVALASAPSGFRNNRAVPARRTYRHGARTVEVAYVLGRDASIAVDGVARPGARVIDATAGAVVLVVDGVRRRLDVAISGDDDAPDRTVDVGDHRGSISFEVVARFASSDDVVTSGSLVAPMPGTVVRVDAVVGADVRAGAVLAVIEAMKMEHPVTAPSAGTVTEVRVAVGDAVEAGTVLVVVARDGDTEGEGE